MPQVGHSVLNKPQIFFNFVEGGKRILKLILLNCKDG